VLLAGGKSTRMGRDKAGVIFEGRPLWERQCATLAALQPAELFVSGRLDGPYAGSGVEVIPDGRPGCGPLSGLEAVLPRMRTTLLCVLAIDLPWMTSAFLERLIRLAIHEGRGVVPRNGDYFEPLAAVYPRALRELIAGQLRSEDYAMQSLVRRSVELGLVVPYDISGPERPLFRNVNFPADIEG